MHEDIPSQPVNPVELANNSSPSTRKRSPKKTPAISKVKIAQMISTGSLTALELMETYRLSQAEAAVLLSEILAEYRLTLAPDFFDAENSSALPPRISSMLEAEADAIVRYKKTDDGVLLYLP